MKFLWSGLFDKQQPFNFGSDPDQGPDPGIFLANFYHLDGGLQFPSASSITKDNNLLSLIRCSI